jgi:hypothetical protein
MSLTLINLSDGHRQMNIRGDFNGWVFMHVTEIMTLIFGLATLFKCSNLIKPCQLMKKLSLLGLVMLTILTGCEFIGDVFGAGVYLGVFMSVFVLVVIIIFVAKIFKK